MKKIKCCLVSIMSVFLFLFCFNLNVRALDTVYEFNYTGDYQEFIVPVNGTYKLEVWGAQGGGNHQISELGYGGKGGYSAGTLELRAGTRLYVYVGGQGSSCISAYCSVAGGFNGGGSGWKKTGNRQDPASSGGGATDMRLVSGMWSDNASLNSRFIVAGGGGAGGMDGNSLSDGDERGGAGGGLEGVVYDNETGLAGTQTSGWGFGYGFAANAHSNSYISNLYGGQGAGGGWYGGGPARNGGWQGAGGGSGYVFTSATSSYVPSGYSVTSEYYLSDAQTIAGNALIPTHDGNATMTGNDGDGYAKITILEYEAIQLTNLELNYLKNGNYEVELPSDTFETTVIYNLPDIIWTVGAGDVVLKAGSNHEIILMDDKGKLTIYNIKVVGPKAYLDNVEFEGVNINFIPQKYEYEFNVTNDIKNVLPKVTVSGGVTYEVSDSSLKVGKNIIKIIANKDGYISSEYTFVVNREYAHTVSPITQEFNYTGSPQEFIAPYTGEYKLEVWGAQGGGAHQKSGIELGYGGKGGYSTGKVFLNAGDKLYVYVGGEGTYCSTARCTSKGGYNGGGSGYKVASNIVDSAASGGGATDIRFIGGAWDSDISLLSRFIVAGGGGGGGMDGNRESDGIERGGDGGGLEGIRGSSETGNPGTQTSGWAFGKGFAATSSNLSYTSSQYGGPGAGGGWYGGYHARAGNGWEGAGGGSGYIWTEATASAVPDGYNVDAKYYLSDAQTIAGNALVPTHDNTSTMTGNGGNGYAKITYYNPNSIDSIVSINTSVGALTPEFSQFVKDYDLYLEMDETELTIDVETRLGEGLVTGEGTFAIDAGNQVLPITFTNINGEVSIYNINVTRVASPSAVLAGFKINGILYPDFDENEFIYEIELPTNTTKINLELLKRFPSQIIPTDTIYDFTEAELSKVLFVSSEGDLANTYYTFNFKRKKSTILKSLDINGGILEEPFDPFKTEYTLLMSEYGRELDIDAKAWFEDAVITTVEPRYVGINDKKITIKVELDGVEATTYTLNIERVEEVTENVEEVFEYTGDYQEFIAPFTGDYKLEVWGAQGGGMHQHSELGYGGKGGYSTGVVHLTKGEKLYVYVGGQGSYCLGTCTAVGGWNGGGNGYKVQNNRVDPAASGGGATDIRLNAGNPLDSASLLSRIIVAGGGGGGGMDGYTNGDERGGDGGGLEGIVYDSETGIGGSQTNGWAFGYGFSVNSSTLNNYSSKIYGGPGAGGGWYGGRNPRNGGWQGAGGGSGFVLTKSTAKNVPSGYIVSEAYYLKDAETIAGNTSMPTYDSTNLMTGNVGNGYAKITATSGVMGDTFLDNIILNDGDIPLDFAPWTLEYDVYLNKDVPSLKIEAIAKDNEAVISGDGEFTFPPGESVHNIVVSTNDGSYKIYKLNITKEPSDDASPKDILIKNPQSYLCGASKTFCNYTFSVENDSYNITYPFETTELTFKAELKTPYQKVTYYLVTSEGDIEIADGKVTLEAGENKVKVKITSESGIDNYYNYTLNKDDSGNNVLKVLEVVNPPTDIEFDSYIYDYTFNVDSTIEKLELKTEAMNPNATIEITGNENLKTGMNQITIKVIAENGNSRSYILNVFKEKSTNTFLSSLEVLDDANVEVELSPTFNKLFTNYNGVVSSNTKSVTINATAEDGNVTGTGTFNLNSGKNVFPVTVISESGDTMIYEIIIMKSRNSNSNLANIEVEGYELSPSFVSSEHEYTIIIPKSIDNLNVKVTPEEDTTTYTIRGNNNLTEKSNTIVITSIAEDKTYQVYKIVVLKETSDNNYLRAIEVVGGALKETFDKESLNYTIDVDSKVNSINIKGILEDNSATLVGNGTYALVKGENIITLTVTSESGNVREYVIKVNKSLNNDVSLESVINNRGSEVIQNFDSNKPYDYLINVQYEVNTIEIVGKPSAATSIVTGNGNYNLNPGEDNYITLRVTAEDNTYKDYIVKVIRDLSDNDDLEFLFIDEGGLAPIFSETTVYYEVKVPSGTNVLHIEAIPEDRLASVDLTSGNSLGNFKFEVDISDLEVSKSKDIDIVVMAQNGNIKIYTVNITKQEATEEDLSLKSLDTNRGDLVPTFIPSTLIYTLEVESNVEDITITAEAFNSDVTIKGTGTYNLKVGKNSIPVFVVGTSGVQKDYQIVVTRKKSSDATLSNLVVKSHVLSPYFDTNTFEYELITSKTSLDFSVIQPTESDATYEVLGNNNFKTGENTVTIRVTAPDEITKKDYVLKVTKEGSKNNNLASLEVVGYTLMPKFHKGVTLYTTEVANDVNSIVIEATAEDTSAIITGTGLFKVNTGENYFEVVVESEAETKKVYTVLITKEASDNNYLASLNVSEGILSPTFDKDTIDYEVTVPYTIDTITINGKLEDINATTSSFGTFNLVEGENIIPIIVISESGLIRTYNVKIIKEAIISAYLSNLEIEGFELDTEFNKENLEYFITVPSDIDNLNVIAIPEDSKGIVEITGDKDLEVGMNEVHVKVTASDNVTTNEYIVYVNKEMSTNNYLSSLIPSEGILSPAFDPKVMEYTVEVDRNVESIEIVATTEDKSAVITSGVGTHNLEIGDNVINIKVKSAIGITRTYKVKVVRKASDNNYLQELKVVNLNDVIELNPSFDKDINVYEVIVNSDINFVQIRATAMDDNAEVTGAGIKSLVTGLNSFEVVVTAEDGSINTYTLNITKEVSSNNYLSSLIPSRGSLKPEFNKEVLDYNLDLTYEETDLGFDAIPESNLSKVTGADIKVTPEGISTRQIIVTAEDGSVRTYTIRVNKETAAEARLDSLIIDNYPFEFDSDTFTYNIKVSASKKKLSSSEITAIAKDENATINMMGDLDIYSGINNIYIIEVIARDGYTTQEYRLNITNDSELYSLNSKVYDINRNDEEDYVIGILPSTKIDDFKLNFDNEQELLHVYKSEVEQTSGLTATAYVIKLEKDGYTYDTLRVIVRGDLTNDGMVNVTDQVKLINYVGKVGTLDKYQMLAADLTFDSRVNVTDQVKLINYVGKVITNQDLNPKREEEGS